MIFRDDKHEELYRELCGCMASADEYHKPIAYLISLDEVLRNHAREVFDFSGDMICPDALAAAWQTSTSRKTAWLAFNLWNGFNEDAERFTALDVFCSDYAAYYWQAIKIRIPWIE